MTRAPRGRLLSSPGILVLLAAVLVTATTFPAPNSARAHLWGGALLLVSIVAGALLLRAERRSGALEDAYRGAIDLTAGLIDSVERHSDHHSRRVAESSVELARALGCTEAEVEDVRIAALLHDLGKLDLPAEALATAAGFAPEELHEAGRRGRAGQRARPALQRVLPMVACCQERWDGTGRRSLKGEAIPLGARILAVADAYDATVTDRAYQKGRTHDEALAALQEASGKQFDPRVVETFRALHETPAADAEIPRAA